MKKTYLALISLVLFPALVCSAETVEFAYTFTKGDMQEFLVKSRSKLSFKAPMMGEISMDMAGETGFTMEILKVRADGVAVVKFTVNRLAMAEGSGELKKVGDIPPQAREILALMDRFGRIRFLKRVRITMNSEGKREFVVIQKASADVDGMKVDVEASAKAGDEEVTLKASVDFSTGKIEASVEVKKTPEEKAKEVAAVNEAPGMDLFPKELFDILKMPDQPMTVGQAITVKLPMLGELKTLLKEIETRGESRIGHMVFTIVPPKGDQGGPKIPGMPEMPGMGEDEKPGKKPGGDDGDDGDEDDDDEEDDGEEPSDEDDEPKPPKAPKSPEGDGIPPDAKAAMPTVKISADIHCFFDLTAGKLVSVAGSVEQFMKSSMIEWKVRTEYDVKRVK